jgi:hypothetical protein
MILREVSVVRGMGFERDATNSVARVWAELKKALSEAEEKSKHRSRVPSRVGVWEQ